MHQDVTEVLDRGARGEFVEHLMGQSSVLGDELSERAHPLRTAQHFQGSLRRVVVDQEVPEALQLIVDLAVGAAQEFADPRSDGAGQAPGAAEEEVDLPAVLARPVASVT